jgi:UDP-2,4-diacetamido-2,4,6-trideoxy-beta-L-altropyranose hydrolase
MNVVFRADASLEIGTGHVMRCLTFAQTLRDKGVRCRFVCREYPGNLLEVIRQHGFETQALPMEAILHQQIVQRESRSETVHLHSDWQTDAEQTINCISDLVVSWLIVDHYALDKRWEVALKSHCRKLMVIDDLANRRHDCDILLDQNYYTNLSTRYKGLVPSRCASFLGPTHVLLRDEFYKAKTNAQMKSGVVKRILVFFGGSDSTNQTQRIVEAIPLLNRPDIFFDIVVGASNANTVMIEDLTNKLANATYYCQVNNMAALMLKADLAIGAGGSTMWERCYLGLPTITVIFAVNQQRTTEDVAKLGAIKYLGWSSKLTSIDYSTVIRKLIKNPKQLRKMSQISLDLVNTAKKSMVEHLICD